jgi:hypothetical protein
MYFVVCIYRMKLVFEINYGGRFDRKCGCIYVGDQVDVHPEHVDPDNMTFVLIESILRQYGYSPGDLIYVRDPTKNLMDGFQLLSSDYDVAYLVAKHVDTPVVELYIVSFQSNVGEDGEDWKNDEEGDDGDRVDYNDTWWDDKISDGEDVFDCLVDSAGPLTMPETDEGVEGDREDGDGNGDGDDSTDVEGGDESGDILDDGNGESGPSGNIKMTSFEDVEVDERDSDIGRSDILLSPTVSEDKDGGISSHHGVEFQEIDLGNPELKLKMKFSIIQLFREAVKQYNVRKGKDIKFAKNERAKCVAICRDPSCQYRVYGRQMATEASFELRSIRPKHTCSKVYKNSIVNSRWISDKLYDKFKIQPDMPLQVIQDEVKRKWNVEVSRSQMYRGRKNARKRLYCCLGEQYDRL